MNPYSSKLLHNLLGLVLVGVEPIKLNSKYWGTQSRNRLFWTNIPSAKLIEQNQIKNDKKWRKGQK